MFDKKKKKLQSKNKKKRKLTEEEMKKRELRKQKEKDKKFEEIIGRHASKSTKTYKPKPKEFKLIPFKPI